LVVLKVIKKTRIKKHKKRKKKRERGYIKEKKKFLHENGAISSVST